MNDRQLTEEAEKLFKNIDYYNKLINDEQNPPPPPTIKIPKLTKDQLEIQFYRLELMKMIYNSRLVVEDCDRMMMLIKTKEEYIMSDAKVARGIHLKLIDRYKKVLSKLPAFDHEIKLPSSFEDDEGITITRIKEGERPTNKGFKW